MKLNRGNHNDVQTTSESRDANEMSTSNLNLVQSAGDEFLDTEESVHGFSFADPTSSSNTTTNNKQTKESSNLISSNDGKAITSADSKKEVQDRAIVDASAPATTTSATVVSAKNSRRNKYTRTSLSPSEARSTVYRGRVKFSPSNMRSLEEIDADPYLYIGQRIAGTTSRVPEARRQPNGRRTPPYQSTTPSRSKEEELEIMEVSVAKQSSTEKNKFWKTRNIAINNYMRRLNPHVNGGASAMKIPEKTENSTKLTTVRYETFHTQPKGSQTSTSITAVNNLAIAAQGDDDLKNVFSRSASNSSRAESPIKRLPDNPIPVIKTIYHPAGLPSLIINVPDDATPVFFNDHRNYQQSDGEIEGSPSDTTDHIETTTSPTLISSLESELKYASKLPDINRLFESLTTTSTSTAANIVETDQSKTPATLESTISSSTTTSVVKSTVSSTESFVPVKSTKRVYTTIPRRKSSTTVFPDYNKTTISTFLSNISSKRNKLNAKNETVSPASTPTSSTARNLISSTVAYKTDRNSSKTAAPVDYEIVAPPSVTPESVTKSIHTNVFYHTISTTQKPSNNEVLVEMYKMNTATYGE